MCAKCSGCSNAACDAGNAPKAHILARLELPSNMYSSQEEILNDEDIQVGVLTDCIRGQRAAEVAAFNVALFHVDMLLHVLVAHAPLIGETMPCFSTSHHATLNTTRSVPIPNCRTCCSG